MIASLQGELESKDLNSAVIIVAGVGYRCQMSAGSLAALGSVGSAVHVETLLVVRADALTLYGFAGSAERALFERLTSVTGVGAKFALALLSAYSPVELTGIITTGDTTRLSAVSGVGKKTAQRIILELQGVLVAASEAQGSLAGAAFEPNSAAAEAALALEAMGFNGAESARALTALESEASSETTASELVRAALKRLG